MKAIVLGEVVFTHNSVLVVWEGLYMILKGDWVADGFGGTGF